MRDQFDVRWVTAVGLTDLRQLDEVISVSPTRLHFGRSAAASWFGTGQSGLCSGRPAFSTGKKQGPVCEEQTVKPCV